MCVWCIVGAANMCDRQHVAACLYQHAWNGVYIETWSAAPSRLTLAYSLPTACPNKALNGLERLQTPKGVLKWKKKSHTISVIVSFSKKLIYISSLSIVLKKKIYKKNLKFFLLKPVRVKFWTREESAPPNQNGGLIYAKVHCPNACRLWRDTCLPTAGDQLS